jgi:hypothetical protein
VAGLLLSVTLLAVALPAAGCAPPPLTGGPDTGGPDSTLPPDATADADGGVEPVPFEEVATIVRDNCANVGCHGGEDGMGNLKIIGATMASDEQVRQALEGKMTADGQDPYVDPGKPGNSALVQAMTNSAGRALMPPTGKLESETIETVRAWIDQGASYE